MQFCGVQRVRTDAQGRAPRFRPLRALHCANNAAILSKQGCQPSVVLYADICPSLHDCLVVRTLECSG